MNCHAAAVEQIANELSAVMSDLAALAERAQDAYDGREPYIEDADQFGYDLEAFAAQVEDVRAAAELAVAAGEELAEKYADEREVVPA